MDGFTALFGAARGANAAAPSAKTDGRAAPMTTGQVLGIIKFLAPELARRAEAHTTVGPKGPSAAWVIAFLAFTADPEPDVALWWRGFSEEDWAGCGLRSRPSVDEVKRFFADVDEKVDTAPTTSSAWCSSSPTWRAAASHRSCASTRTLSAPCARPRH